MKPITYTPRKSSIVGITIVVMLVTAHYYKTEEQRLEDLHAVQMGFLPSTPEPLFDSEDFKDPWDSMVEILEEEREDVAESQSSYMGEKELAFFKRFYPTAKMEQEKFGIPFSIKMGQGILESSWGESVVAQNANNHFGVKTRGKGYKICDDSCSDRFKIYPSAWASWRAHSQFLHDNKRYAPLFADKFNRKDFEQYRKLENCLLKQRGKGCVRKGVDPNFTAKLNELEKNWDVKYKRFAIGLDLVGYATDVNYSKHLIELIERYNLQQYDN